VIVLCEVRAALSSSNMEYASGDGSQCHSRARQRYVELQWESSGRIQGNDMAWWNSNQ